MLQSAYRFHGHGSLNYLFRNGSTVRNRIFLVRFVANKRRKTSRLSVIVGKKIAKSAVKRNRMRRRVYEIIRRHWPEIKPQVDMALTILSADTLLLPASELERSVLEVLARAGLYQNSS